MQNRFVDIHTHKHYADGTAYIFSCAIGKDGLPPAGTVFSAGIHPWAAGAADVGRGLELLSKAPVAAVGEIGLDYAVDVDRDTQKRVLEAQLGVAEDRRLPVIIHCVRAYYDVLGVLGSYELPAVIFHGYIGSPEQTADIIRSGYYLSFNRHSLISHKTAESLRQMPLDRLFLETDDAPEDITSTYAEAADMIGVNCDYLKEMIWCNYKRIFG